MRSCERRTDGRTDWRATTYSALCICCMLSRANNHCYLTQFWRVSCRTTYNQRCRYVDMLATCGKSNIDCVADWQTYIGDTFPVLNLTVFDWCTFVRDGWTDDSIYAIHAYMLSRVNCSCDRRTETGCTWCHIVLSAYILLSVEIYDWLNSTVFWLIYPCDGRTDR